MGIVYAQHDLGTMLVIMVCAAAVLVVAGLKPVHIVVLLMLAATLVGAAVVSGKVQAYQLDRLTGFADQSTKGETSQQLTPTGYNLKASKTAIASGGLSGAGLFEGLQTKNGFVPEQHTDFIFTAVGEDLGFVGGATLLALYALLAWRIWRIALLSSDFFGTLLAIGVLAMFAIQVFENVGMTMGIMPITGIPLPFMSYGGSSDHRQLHRHRPGPQRPHAPLQLSQLYRGVLSHDSCARRSVCDTAGHAGAGMLTGRGRILLWRTR